MSRNVYLKLELDGKPLKGSVTKPKYLNWVELEWAVVKASRVPYARGSATKDRSTTIIRFRKRFTKDYGFYSAVLRHHINGSTNPLVGTLDFVDSAGDISLSFTGLTVSVAVAPESRERGKQASPAFEVEIWADTIEWTNLGDPDEPWKVQSTTGSAK